MSACPLCATRRHLQRSEEPRLFDHLVGAAEQGRWHIEAKHFAPAPSAFFVVKDTNGEPHGVTVDLAVELGWKLSASQPKSRRMTSKANG